VGTPNTNSNVLDGLTRHIQIQGTGAGSLEIETKLIDIQGQTAAPAFVSQTTISDATIILDMVNVREIRLTATTATVPFSVISYS